MKLSQQFPQNWFDTFSCNKTESKGLEESSRYNVGRMGAVLPKQTGKQNPFSTNWLTEQT